MQRNDLSSTLFPRVCSSSCEPILRRFGGHQLVRLHFESQSFYNCCCLSNLKSFCQTREEIHKQILSPKVNKIILDVAIPEDVTSTDINLELNF